MGIIEKAAEKMKRMAGKDHLAGQAERLSKLYEHIPYFSLQYFRMLFKGRNFTFKNAAYVNADIHNEYYNVTDGFRETTDQPATSENKIYIFGPSTIFGTYAEDKDTIASCLQRVCNNELPGKFAVHSKAVRSSSYSNAFLILRSLNLQAGDIIIFFNGTRVFHAETKKEKYNILRHSYTLCRDAGCSFAFFTYPRIRNIVNPSDEERIIATGNLKRHIHGKLTPPVAFAEKYVPDPLADMATAWGCPCYDLQPYFNRPHGLGELWVDKSHLGPGGNREIARRIYELFIRHLFIRQKNAEDVVNNALQNLKKLGAAHYEKNENLSEWLVAATARQFAGKKRIGAIVMNCNPFTKGHLYLIETAAPQVDGLYIFVVEEDKSIFPFSDRMEMIRAGVAHLQGKVRVVPSGNFIISSLSFPEYFDKDGATTSVDTSHDVILFGSMIAPRLNITARFVGDEPHCAITAGYNETMKNILPAMGVEVKIIPRLEREGLPISASQVRALLRAGDVATLKTLVPPSTCDYLAQAGFVKVKGCV